jgi:pimeloyl-ACP methyl ester carboxylesterase
MLAFLAALEAVDISPLLASISIPTLVMHSQSLRVGSPDAAREIAAALPDARLMMLSGINSGVDEVFGALRSFFTDAPIQGRSQRVTLLRFRPSLHGHR